MTSSSRSALTNSAKSKASYTDRSLRMTSMEKFHWLDRNPQYPNYVFATLRFAIRINPELAQRSLAIALQRQPLASMEPKLVRGRWYWQPIPDQEFDDERVFRSLELTETDLAKFGSVTKHEFNQVYVSCFLTVVNFPEAKLSGDTVSELRFYSHHAASDGVASIGLVNDWLMIYNNLVAGESVESGLIELDATSFHRRGALGLLSWNYLKGLPRQAIALFGAAKFIFRKTKMITPESLPTKSPKPFPAIAGAWVEAPVLEADRRNATDHRVGFAAWCLAKCFSAIESWNQTRTPDSSEPQQNTTAAWRILLPISIRNSRDRSSVAANRTAIVQVDRQPPPSGGDLTALSQSIDYEINFIRRWQLEKMFLIVIRLASFSNSWLSKVANNPNSRGAAIFTHLGRPFKRAMIHANRISKSAQTPLELAQPIDFDLAGPVRSGTPINISLARFERRLKVSLHYDAQVVSSKEAQRLLRMIVDLFPC